MPDPTKQTFEPLTPCLHCAIAQLVNYRNRNGIQDDEKEVLARFCESIAEVCAMSDDVAGRKELVAFCANLLRGMWHDVLAMDWKSDNARSNQTNDKRH